MFSWQKLARNRTQIFNTLERLQLLAIFLYGAIFCQNIFTVSYYHKLDLSIRNKGRRHGIIWCSDLVLEFCSHLL